ncbi:hypothetical protein M8J77_000919 [Diaphorina citri]|nr:hypothetical protein M8J77_000919 [Diaphorina citri]
MKLTQILNAHHRSRWRKYQWRAKGWLVKKHSFAKQVLDEHNIPYESALEFVKEPKPVISFDYAHVFNPPQLRKDANHPDFKPVPCFSFGDSNVLLEGLDQAKLLTNTVEVNDDLPEKILKLKEENPVSDAVHKIVQKNLYSALVYDGAQEKLPIRKDPERPAYRFPRDYGITDFRKNMLVSNKLLQLCESISPLDISTRAVLNNARFQLTIEKDEDLVQFALRGDKVLMADSPLPSFLDNHQSASAIDLPNLYPLKPTISMEKNHFYKRDDFFPLHPNASHPHIHTALIHYNDTEVKNSYATPVTDSQVMGRSLIKAFVMAAAQARYLYGDEVKDLPSPCTIQLVHTDARMFHFCAFQLNTLDISSTHKVRNIFWQHPLIEIASRWGYEIGRPHLSGYNPHVFDLFCAFYRNAGRQSKPEAIQAEATA